MQPFRVSYGDFPLLSNSLKGIHKVGRRLEGCSCSQAFTSVKISGPYTLGMQCKFERRLDGFYYINNRRKRLEKLTSVGSKHSNSILLWPQALKWSGVMVHIHLCRGPLTTSLGRS